MRVSISVNPFGAFVTQAPSTIYDTASLPLRVETSRGGQPVSGATIYTVDGSLILGTTDANGIVEATYPIAHPPTEGDFTSTIFAFVNSIIFSSDPITLYSSRLLGEGEVTLTEDEAQWYSLNRLMSILAQPGVKVPGFWGDLIKVVHLLVKIASSV